MRAAVVVGVAGALLATGAGEARAATATTIVVTSVTLSVVNHDVDPKGPSKGDTVVYRDRLLDTSSRFGKGKGAEIGRDSGTLTFTGPDTITIEGQTTLPGGTVKLSGPVASGPGGAIVIRVVGGTGAYAHMRGTLTVGPGKDHVLNTYRLVRTSALVA